MSSMAKVLVIEDDPTMAEMVAYNLARQGIEVEVAEDGTDGLRKAKAKDVSLIVLDVMLPTIGGMAIAEEVRKTRPDLPILMVTALGQESDKLKGFEAGADDYLTKPFSMDELMARVKALLRRSRTTSDRPEPPWEIKFGDLRILPRDLRCWVADEELTLRPKEFSLLATLASEPGRLFNRVELAEIVWGYANLGDTRTIDTHVKNLRRKVETPSRFTYVETVRGAGYRFRVSPKT